MLRSLWRRAARLLPSLVSRFGGAAMQLVANVLLGRVLGASGVGLYYTFDAWQRTVGLIAGVGLPSLTLRSVSRLWAAGSRATQRTILRYVLIAAGVGVVCAALLTAAAGPLARVILDDPSLAPYLVWSGISATLFISVRILAQALKGTEAPAFALFVEYGILPTGLVAALAAFSWLRIDATPLAVVFAHVAALAVATTVGAWGVFGAAGGGGGTASSVPSGGAEDDRDDRLPLGTLAYFWGITVAQMAFTTLPIILLPLFASQAEVGQFGASTKLLAASGVAISALSSYFSPKFAVHADDPAVLRKLLGASQWASLALFTPFFVAFFAFPEVLLGVFGSDFPAGASLLRILALGQLVSSGVGLIGYFSSMIGLERVTFVLIVATLAVLLVGIAILGPRFGASGVAIATSLAVVFRSTALYVVARTTLR